MYTEKEILCLLKTNKEKMGAFYDNEKKEFGICIKEKPVSFKKSKYVNTYRISDVEKKYLQLLELNPKVLQLEYSAMDYYILISTIPRNKLKLPDGMKYDHCIGFYDDKNTLNVSRQY